MKITKIPKIMRILILIGVMTLGYIFWNLLINSAPKENILWLNQHLEIKNLIFGLAGISLFVSELVTLFPELSKQEKKQ